MSTVLFARQSIFNAELQVIAYELLYRLNDTHHENVNTLAEFDGDMATSQLLSALFTEMDITDVVGNYPVFLNFTRKSLLGPMELCLPKERVVIEVLEDVGRDATILSAIEEMAKKGYQIALDDFVHCEQSAPLLSLAKFVKLDVLALSKEEVEAHVELLKAYPCKLLAEKVETYEQLEWCKSLGFDYFQGYFLSRPNLMKGHKADTNRLVVLEMVSQLQNPDLTIEELESLLIQDAVLTYQLFRILNAAENYRSHQFKSIREAIVMLGLKRITCWASMIALANTSHKSTDLMEQVLVRAHMCELLGREEALNAETCFTVGLFSNLEAMLDQRMKDILGKISLSEEINAALLLFEGKIGDVLHNVIHFSQGEWNNTQETPEGLETYNTVYLDSLRWAKEVCSVLYSRET